jgi:hypothetical protein
MRHRAKGKGLIGQREKVGELERLEGENKKSSRLKGGKIEVKKVRG